MHAIICLELVINEFLLSINITCILQKLVGFKYNITSQKSINKIYQQQKSFSNFKLN